MNKNRSQKAGVNLEQTFQDLARRFLEGVDNVWLAKSHNELDNGLKADLVIELFPPLEEETKKKKKPVPEEALLVQVKSSKEQAIEHLKRRSVMGGQYRVPGVVWKESPWNMCLQLRDVTGLPFNSRIETLVRLATRMQGQTYEAKFFPHYIQDLTVLGFARLSPCKREITFNSDPPDMVFHDYITEQELD